MDIEVLTIFPDLFNSFLASSLIEKGVSKGALAITVTNIRDFTDAPHHRTDDSPYGGGPGMVMTPEPLMLAIEAAKERLPEAQVALLTPSGMPFNQPQAKEFATSNQLILICGRYEGVDQRVIDLVVDHEVSVGDFVVMGGEIPAMLVIEAIGRLVPGVVGNSDSPVEESFSKNKDDATLLEGPQYTRPATFRGLDVPDVLLSGDHAAITKWRAEQSKERTAKLRPDLLCTDKKKTV